MIFFILIALFFSANIFGAGYFLAKKIDIFLLSGRLKWIELIALSAAIVILIVGMIGVMVVVAPWHYRQALSICLLGVILGLSIWSLLLGQTIFDHRNASKVQKIFYLGFILFGIISFKIGLMPVTMPSSLPDGAYVAKNDVLPVRIQYITGNLQRPTTPFRM